RVLFEVRNPTQMPISVVFGVNGHDQVDSFGQKAFATIYTTTTFQPTIRLDFSSLDQQGGDLTNVHTLFSVTADQAHTPNGGTILIDNIRFDPPPASQATALGLPLSTQTFGVVPVTSPGTGKVPVPIDQSQRNVASTYEASLTILALLKEGSPSALNAARAVA